LHRRIAQHLNAVVGRWLPEQRLFLKSDTSTRFVRLQPVTQLLALGGATLLCCWSVIATSILLIDTVSFGSSEEQVVRAQVAFEERLNVLSHERDLRTNEAGAAQARFAQALEEVSMMQSALLASEERRRELETGIDVIQSTLRRTLHERDAVLAAAAAAAAALDQPDLAGAAQDPVARAEGLMATLDFVSETLGKTASERDQLAADAAAVRDELAALELEQRLMEQRNDEIFATLEGAVMVSVEPLDKMFRAVGMDSASILDQVRRGYSGQGGPSLTTAISSMGSAEPDPDASRAAGILETLDRLNLYRIAAETLPFDMPVKSSYRMTSPFGGRWGRLHEGVDMAGPTGTPIYATADGVVTHAGWQSGYGYMVEIRHDFGTTTRYGHLSKIRVSLGQKVSRADRIGDMGSTGRSTGPHLHYEVRVGGKPVNPMTFIKAASNVF
jgi:murein DD-endopeptidase MepM/ murein hydrolase activator NlpD